MDEGFDSKVLARGRANSLQIGALPILSFLNDLLFFVKRGKIFKVDLFKEDTCDF